MNIWMIWENETSLPEKEDFYSHFNMEGITDADYVHAKRLCKDFEIKNLEYDNLYVQNDTLLLADVSENFRNMCIEIYELDNAKKKCSAPGLAWLAVFKKTKVKLDLLTDINMLLMTHKYIMGGICHSIY